MNARTITEILKDADKSLSMNELLTFDKELIGNKYKYSLVDLWELYTTLHYFRAFRKSIQFTKN